MSHLTKTPSKLTIVTTNYDTLLEDAADSIGYTVMDGFSFSHRPYFDSDMFEWNLVRDIENVKTRELEYKKNIINLLKLHNDEIRAIQNHLDDYSIKHIKKLNQGECILTSVNLLHNVFIHVKKSKRKQNNETPIL